MWLAAVVTLVLPGFGQAAADRIGRAYAWCIVALVFLIAAVWVPILGIAAIAVRVAAAVDAVWCVRRASAPLVWGRNTSFAVGLIAASPIVAAVVIVKLFKIPSSAMYPTLEIGDHIGVESLSSIQRGDVIVFHYPCDHGRDYIKRLVAMAGDTVEVRCNVLYVNGTAVPSELASADCTYSDYDESRDTWIDRPCSRYHERFGGHAYDVFHDPDRPARDKRAQLAEGDSRDFPRPGEPPGCRNASDVQDHLPDDAGKLVVTKETAAPCELQSHYVVPPHGMFVMGDNRNNSNDSRIWGSLDESAVVGRARWILWSRHRSRIGRIE
jgi:signal peptidase I